MQTEHLHYHAEAEADHWWFAARRAIVLDHIERFLPRRPAPLPGGRVLDIGCGAGGMLDHLSRWGEPLGIDPSPEAVALAAAGGRRDVRQGALPHELPVDRAPFDLVTVLDVLEHVEDDAAAVRSIRGLLAPGGLVVLTVPAFPFLWSRHDVVNAHYRRYTRPRLVTLLREGGLEVLAASYFNTLLFAPIAAVRLASRLAGRRPGAHEGRVPAPVNRFLFHVFRAERRILRRVTLPFGVSVLAVARRPGPEPPGGSR